MIDASEFRGLDPGAYPGRMSPGGFSSSSYATLTPLQPLPPISTMSDKFSHYGHHHQHPGSNGGFAPLAMHGMTGYPQYDKLGSMSGAMNMSPPHGTAPMLGAGSSLPSPPPYAQNGLPEKGLNGYETASYGGAAPQRELTRLGSPQSPTSLHSPMLPPLNGLSPHTPPQAHLAAPATPPQPPPPQEAKPARVLLPVVSSVPTLGQAEEINTKELAQRISAELKRYSIPQAIFAQRVLCRSQGTLSDLLRNPKPWSKLKSGRETFRRMYKWLEEPEFQRMSALRLA
ncbi:ONECUT DNA binding protein, putative, partial [Ixodes scapularis]